MSAPEAKLHPFFKASRPAPISDPSLDALSDGSHAGSRKKRKPNPQPKESSAPRRRQGTLTLDGPLISLLKPQRKSSVEEPNGLETPPTVDDDGEEDAEGEADDEYLSLPAVAAVARTPSSSPPVEAMSTTTISAPETTTVNPPTTPAASIARDKPAKVLKFNMKTGTLGSPPKPKAKTLEETQPVKRGRPRKKLLVTMRYGATLDSRVRIGRLITSILEQPQAPQPVVIVAPAVAPAVMPAALAPTIVAAPVQVSAPVVISGTPTSSKKSTHPFFKKSTPAATVIPATTASPAHVKRNTVSSSTPCSPKKRMPMMSAGLNGGLAFSTKNSGLKVPGAAHPLFPPREMVHVRGPDSVYEAALCKSGISSQRPYPSTLRKSKQQAVGISVTESVIHVLQDSIDFSGVRDALERLSSDFAPVPRTLRVPIRHVESGRKVQFRIRSQLRTALPEVVPVASSDDDSADELAIVTRVPWRKKATRHPFVERLWNSLPGTLSAFDRCTCECSAWSIKYAPVTAGEVLQSGREALLLKEWLLALKVDAVHTGSWAPKKAKTKKRRKKKGRLDGFIAESDEEGAAYESSDDENAYEWLPDRDGSRRSVVRNAAAGSGKVGNAVVISGSRGVGKTATVYAVAKELGFEVFEINAASRRAGKDILERVGDMTRNHLVQHGETMGSSGSTAKPSGGLVNFFAKRKPTKRDDVKEKEREKKEPASQKQSLILIEEADILYDEDRAFWATLATLMATAKRPFVFTCNDETTVPLGTLPLHGIFRLRAPPVAEVVDSLLLIAAAEGHVLRRAAVEGVIAERSGDLRGALAQLQFWCQIGVGDQRGGFGWLLARWPKGCDVDERGDTVRVISEGGLEEGMGWLGDKERQGVDGVEVGVEVWRDFRVDVYSWTGAEGVPEVPTVAGGRRERLRQLEAFEEATDDMSTADVLSMGSFATFNYVPIDATQPEVSAKRREDAVLGSTLLDAEAVWSYDELSQYISTSLKATAFCVVTGRTETKAEDLATELLVGHFTSPEPPSIGRSLFSLAFDSIAVSTAFVWAAHIDPSVFDRPLQMIVLDVAPYVRGIIYSEQQRRKGALAPVQEEEEGRGKRARARERARREWFVGCEMEEWAILGTAGKMWVEGAWREWREEMEKWREWWVAEGRKLEEEKRVRGEQARRMQAQAQAQAQHMPMSQPGPGPGPGPMVMMQRQQQQQQPIPEPSMHMNQHLISMQQQPGQPIAYSYEQRPQLMMGYQQMYMPMHMSPQHWMPQIPPQMSQQMSQQMPSHYQMPMTMAPQPHIPMSMPQQSAIMSMSMSMDPMMMYAVQPQPQPPMAMDYPEHHHRQQQQQQQQQQPLQDPMVDPALFGFDTEMGG